ncbi:MAG: hypothetical protein ACUVTR_05980 [Dehalococcoidia bacterium]
MTGTGGKDLPRMDIKPVAAVKSQIKEPSLVVKPRDLKWKGVLGNARKERSTISEILASDDFTGILDGIENLSHILVLYPAQLASEQGRSLIKAYPMGRKDLPGIGIFATLSSVQPKPVCVSAVPLPGGKGNLIRGYHNEKVSKWMEQIERIFGQASTKKH